MSTTCNYLEDGIWIADDVRVLESSINMAVTISIMYVASLGLGKFSIIWRPFSAVVFPSRCLVFWTCLTGWAFCSSSSLIFLLLVPLVWGVKRYIVATVHLLALYYPHFPPPNCVCHLCHRWINFCHLWSKYSPIHHRILCGSLYRILGVQIVIVYLAYWWSTQDVTIFVVSHSQRGSTYWYSVP